MKTEQSKILQERASKVMVGGVNSPVRSFARVGAHPIFAAKANGAYLWDVDGNEYIDLVMSYGPHLFGHRHPKIVAAVVEAMERSSCYGMSTEQEIQWAELFLKRTPWAEKVRAVSTGTEATSTAVRLVRGITGRDVIVKFSGHYHGHADSLLVDAGSGVATHSGAAVPECKGVPVALANLARVLAFNDVPALEECFKNDGNNIAGVILEPVVGNMGVIPPKVEFLKKLRSLCDQHGALLIFDEVMCGLRIHPGSTQALYGVTPDLACYGKIVGGGFPMAAVAGPKKWMDHLSPLGSVYQAGTLSGNPVSVAAGIAMMNLIDQESPYEKLEKFGSDLSNIYQEAAHKVKIDLRVERVGSMMSVYFRKDPVINAQDARQSNMDQFKQYFWAMLDQGVMLPPSLFEAFFLAVPHVELDRGLLAQKIEKAFQAIKQL